MRYGTERGERIMQIEPRAKQGEESVIRRTERREERDASRVNN